MTVSAWIRLLRTEDGGRLTAVRTGYRPTVRFGNTYTESSIDLIGRDVLAPGEECQAQIVFVNADYVEEFLRPEQTFDITEGTRKVGAGRILMVGEA